MEEIQDGVLCPFSRRDCSRKCAMRLEGRVFRMAEEAWGVELPGCVIQAAALAALDVRARVETFPELLGAATVSPWEPMPMDLAGVAERMKAPRPNRKKKSPPAPLCQRGEDGSGGGEAGEVAA